MIMQLKHKLASARHVMREHAYPNPAYISPDKALFSFTFDDAPVSSIKNGATLLEKYGARGTYYIALGMATAANQRDPSAIDYKRDGVIYFANESDVSELHLRGHDVGCHSFSHKPQSSQTLTQIIEDNCKNKTKLEDILGCKINHSSYPHGDVRLLAKRVLRHQYQTLRSTASGMNYGRVDLSYLRAIKIYSNNMDRNRITALIDKAIFLKAWTIFYTHEICLAPNQWGTTIDDFDWILTVLVNRGAQILSMSQAANILLK